MSLEIVKVTDVRSQKSKDGKEYHFLSLEVTLSFTVFMDERAIALGSRYQQFVGREALLACEVGARNGRPSINLVSTSYPVDVPPDLPRTAIAVPSAFDDPADFSLVPASPASLVDKSTGEVKTDPLAGLTRKGAGNAS